MINLSKTTTSEDSRMNSNVTEERNPLKNKQKKWSEDDINILLKHMERNLRIKDALIAAAEELQRPLTAVTQKWYTIKNDVNPCFLTINKKGCLVNAKNITSKTKTNSKIYTFLLKVMKGFVKLYRK